MTEEQMAAAQARLDAITPGEWKDDGYRVYVGDKVTGEGHDYIIHHYVIADMKHTDEPKDWPAHSVDSNREFIVHAPNDLRAALAALRRVRQELRDAPRQSVNWPNPGEVNIIEPANKCGAHECDDLPHEPGPCDSYVACECGWPAASGTHCKQCQHVEICHVRKSIIAALERTEHA
ncbi:MAG: hypothetical protein NVSMB31_14010 [Vulcanimicrobiaceae bacterium]